MLGKIAEFLAGHLLIQLGILTVVVALVTKAVMQLRTAHAVPLWVLIFLPVALILSSFSLGRWLTRRSPRRVPGYGSKWIECGGALWHFVRAPSSGDEIFQRKAGPLCPKCQRGLGGPRITCEADGPKVGPEPWPRWIRVAWTCDNCGEITGETKISEGRWEQFARSGREEYNLAGTVADKAEHEALAQFRHEQFKARRK